VFLRSSSLLAAVPFSTWWHRGAQGKGLRLSHWSAAPSQRLYQTHSLTKQGAPKVFGVSQWVLQKAGSGDAGGCGAWLKPRSGVVEEPPYGQKLDVVYLRTL